MGVRIAGRWLADDDASVETVDLLQPGVSVPEMGACVAGPLIPEDSMKILFCCRLDYRVRLKVFIVIDQFNFSRLSQYLT